MAVGGGAFTRLAIGAQRQQAVGSRQEELVLWARMVMRSPSHVVRWGPVKEPGP